MTWKETLKKLQEEIPPTALAAIMGIGTRTLQYWREEGDGETRNGRPATLRHAGQRLVDFGKRVAAVGRVLLKEADAREKREKKPK